MSYTKKDLFIKLLPICIFIVILGLTIGYSAYSVTLNIQDVGFNVIPKSRSIEITNVIAKNGVSNALSNYETYKAKNTINTMNISSSREVPNDTLMSVGINLPNEDSKITYTVTVANYGSIELGLYDIAGFPDNLEYTISNYNMQDKLCNNYSCSLGISKDIDITISYKSYDPNKTTYNLNLNLDFRPFNKINYVNINGYKPYIINGGTLVLDFTSNPKENIVVEGDSIAITGYTYENYILTVPNVTSDITVKSLTN